MKLEPFFMNQTPDSQLLLDIYSAATEPETWASITDQLAQLTEAAGCILMLSELQSDAPWAITSSSDLWRSMPDQVDFYHRNLAHHEVPAFQAMWDLPAQTFISTADADAQWYRPEDAPDTKYLAEHAGIQVRCGARINDNASWHDSIVFQFSEQPHLAPVHQLERTRPYFPHLAKTLELSRMYGRLFHMYNAVLAALDHVRVAMVVVSAAGESVVANAEAQRLFDNGNFVRLDTSKRLTLNDPKAQRALSAACSELSMTAMGSANAHVKQIVVGGTASSLPLLLELMPLRDGLNELGGGFSGAMIMIIGPNTKSQVDISSLAYICKLTPAEADVCKLLVRGLSNQAIAEHRSTRVDTVKSQIAQIYRKTKVTERTGLVRLAVRMQPPVGPAPE